MKHGLKKRILSLVLCISMVLPMIAQPMPVYSVENEESIAPLTNPFTPETIIRLPDGTTTKSQSYRIPSMVTLADGTIVAAADIRWNTTFDGGGLDTLVARSTDGGANWSYTVANYLGDNGNVYNGSHSTAFLDPSLLVAADGKTVYMLVDLYPYGVALNGDKDSNNAYVHTQPSTDVGFNDAGYLKLSNNNHTSYDYYLKDSKIYTSNHEEVSGYTIDPYFNITGEDGTDSNLFFENSPFKVVRTGYLYLTKSTNGGETWSVPQLLNVKTTSERVCLVAPGNSITTSNDTMIFPVYSYHGDNAATGNTQRLSFLYSTDGVDWKRTEELNAATAGKLDKNWASEAAVVELQDGTLRFFIRNGSQRLQYVDYTMGSGWGTIVTMDNVKTNSNTQISAITYSRTVNGKKVILVSCPTGPDRNGSNESGAGKRLNGSIFVFTVDSTGKMELANTIEVTKNNNQFMYSCLTERADGSVAILYEDQEHDWGVSGGEGNTYDPSKVSTYYTITGKSFTADELGVYPDLVEMTKVMLKEGVTQVTLYQNPADSSAGSVSVTADELDGVYLVDGWYIDPTTGEKWYLLKNSASHSWPEEYDAYRYVPTSDLEETDQGLAYPIVDFTNPAPIIGTSTVNPSVTPYVARRSMFASPAQTFAMTRSTDYSTFGGLLLRKEVMPNEETPEEDFLVKLEAFTTGSVSVQRESMAMDIVLVLDQSGSMAYCIGCGKSVGNNSYHEVDPEDVVATGTYYLGKGSSRVYYCAQCQGWHTNQNHNGTKYNPGTSSYGTNRQFYEKCQSRLDALKNAVNKFIEKVHTAAKGTDGSYGTEDDVRHRIAIVGFANYSNYNDYSNTEVFIGANQYKYGTNASGQYANALQFMNTQSGYNNVVASKDALSASGATYVDLGIEMANGIFGANDIPLSDSEERGRVMIVFTDGVPGYSGGFGDGSYESTGWYSDANNATAVANKAIENAYTTKNTYNATVYTVGVFEGANASNPTTLPGTNNITQNSKDDNANRYMHLTSSNYKEAESMTQTGTINDKVSSSQSYYMSAGSTNALDSIFEAMSESIEGKADVELGADTIVKDIVTPQFTLPKNTSDVTVQQFDCLSYNAETDAFEWSNTGVDLETEATVTFDTVKNTVSVTGFDFTHNYVASVGRDEFDSHAQGEFRGRKLVITFTIKPDPDFLGGDNVKTNDEKSGVYAPGEESAAGTFDPGYVNVQLKNIYNAAQDKHIYLGNTTNLIGILNLHVAESQSGKDLQSIANGINNAYVDLVYTVTVNGGTVYTYTIEAGEEWDQGEWKQGDTVVDLSAVSVTEDTDYSVTCVMTSVNNNSNQKSTNAPANIFVYKPTVTFKDSVQNYKKPLNNGAVYENVNAFVDTHKVSIVWKHGETLSTQVAMEGDAPEITFQYAYEDGVFDDFVMNSVNDVPVNVTATIQGTGTAIGNNEGVTYKHQNCGSGVNCKYGMGDEAFIVHVINALTSLTIEKTGAADIDVNQSFLFTVTGKDADGEDISLTVTVHGNGSTIIDGLVIGNEYTITEKTDWSWRYKFSKWEHKVNADDTTTTTGSTNGAAIKLGENGTITFTNTRNKVHWLDGDSWCNNIFKNPNE